MLLLDPLKPFNYCFFLALLFFVDIRCVVPDPSRCPSLRILRWSQRAIGKYRTTYLRWGRLQWFNRPSKFTFGTWSDHVRLEFNSLLCYKSAKPGTTIHSLNFFIISHHRRTRKGSEEKRKKKQKMKYHPTKQLYQSFWTGWLPKFKLE